MTMWPISTRVNKPENDDPSLLDRIGDPFNVWAPLMCGGPSLETFTDTCGSFDIVGFHWLCLRAQYLPSGKRNPARGSF